MMAMEMECDLEVSSSENGEFSFGPKDISLDVKLTFARVCSMIDALDDTADSMYILKKIQKEAKILMQRKKNYAAKDKLNETQHSTISGPLQTSLHLQEPKFSRVASNESISEHHNSSYFGDNSKLIHHSRTIPEAKSFRPIKKRNPHDSVQLGAIPEEVLVIEDDSTDVNSSETSSYQETIDENVNYLLKRWSIKKSNNNLHLTGVKMDRKGKVIEKDFISEKVLARPDNDVIRTEDGDFLLDEPLSDPKKALPEEIRAIFTKEKYFPKFWRKALNYWIELDQKAEKEKKKAEAKNKANSEPKQKRKSLPKANKENTPAESKKSAKGIKKNTPTMSKKSTPNLPRKNTPNDNKKTKVNEKKPPANKGAPKYVVKKTSEPSARLKKMKKTESKSQEKGAQSSGKKTNMTEVDESISDKEKLSRNPSRDTEGDDGPFSDENDDLVSRLNEDSMFLLPKTSMTPTGLLDSIKNTSVKGRFTPPTEMFDNLYGKTQSSNSSIANSSFTHLTNKNNNVVKRMAKAKSTSKVQKIKEVGYENIDKEKSEENELVSEVLKAAALKTTTTPPLIKEVFRGVEDTDESDVVDSD